MSTRKQPKPPTPMTDAELRDDLKRAIIAVLLRSRTWTTEDLEKPMTVREVADALVGIFL